MVEHYKQEDSIMAKDALTDNRVQSQEVQADRLPPDQSSERKKPFVKPELTRHDSLLTVTAFFGGFTP
jgi:hypothetical protein